MKILRKWDVAVEMWYNENKMAEKRCSVMCYAATAERAREIVDQYMTQNPDQPSGIYHRLGPKEWTRECEVILSDEPLPYTHYDPTDEARMA